MKQWAIATACALSLCVGGTASAQIRVNGQQSAEFADVTVESLGSIGLVTFTRDAIGVTPTDALVITNTTAAAAGAQQISPRLRLRGNGWKTDATAASQTVDFAQYLLPVQGAAAPSGNLLTRVSINGAAYTTIATLSSNGAYTSPNTVSANALATTVGLFHGATFIETMSIGAPAVSSCGDAALGTGSTDSFGTVTGTTQTGCVITFSNALGTNDTACVIQNATTEGQGIATSSTTALTVTLLTAGDDFSYHCLGM